MKKYYSGSELDEIGDAIVRKFYKDAKSLPASVDIDKLVEEHLGLRICYRSIAETPARYGFLSDGTFPLWVSNNGKIVQETFPKGTIVIEKAFLNPNEDGRRRFTIAHEAAHFILDSFVAKASFNTVFDKQEQYSKEELIALFSPNEYQVDRLAAALLMPTYLFAYNYALRFPKSTIKVYGSETISVEDDVLIKMFANSMRVSKQAMMIRLKTSGKFEYRPMEEFVGDVGVGGNEG